MFSKLSNVKFF